MIEISMGYSGLRFENEWLDFVNDCVDKNGINVEIKNIGEAFTVLGKHCELYKLLYALTDTNDITLV